jgi:hypothetical protein
MNMDGTRTKSSTEPAAKKTLPGFQDSAGTLTPSLNTAISNPIIGIHSCLFFTQVGPARLRVSTTLAQRQLPLPFEKQTFWNSIQPKPSFSEPFQQPWEPTQITVYSTKKPTT